MKDLKDIKPLVDIEDGSLLIAASLILALLLIIGFSYWKFFKSTQDRRIAVALEKLHNLDFSNSKETAYTFKRYAYVVSNIDNINQLNQINHELAQYKYKKQVAELDPALVQKIKAFTHV